jgi:hypothetical protein
MIFPGGEKRLMFELDFMLLGLEHGGEMPLFDTWMFEEENGIHHY